MCWLSGRNRQLLLQQLLLFHLPLLQGRTRLQKQLTVRRQVAMGRLPLWEAQALHQLLQSLKLTMLPLLLLVMVIRLMRAQAPPALLLAPLQLS